MKWIFIWKNKDQKHLHQKQSKKNKNKYSTLKFNFSYLIGMILFLFVVHSYVNIWFMFYKNFVTINFSLDFIIVKYFFWYYWRRVLYKNKMQLFQCIILFRKYLLVLFILFHKIELCLFYLSLYWISSGCYILFC